MSRKTCGLILREMSTGENDRLITILTRDFGVIKAFCKGAKKIKSRFTSSTELFVYSSMSVKPFGDAYILEHADPIETFFLLRSDIEKISLAQYFAQLEEEFAPDNESSGAFLRLMLNSLHLLCEDKRSNIQIKSTFEMRILSMAGYMPNLISCENCGVFKDDVMSFNYETGSILCRKCMDNTNEIGLPLSVITALRHICYSDDNKIFGFTLSPENFDLLSKVTENYLLINTQRNFKTLDFYHSIK